MFCGFEDEGVALVEASTARENQESGPAKLSIWNELPFDEGNFKLFVSQHSLEYLTLCYVPLRHDVPLRHEESCRALAAADLQNLEFHSYDTLPDGGAALVESVKDGRGPRGLRLGRYEFGSAERLLSFINALRGDTYLQRLDLSEVYYSHGLPQALASALLENKGLVHFGLDHYGLDNHFWGELMAAISTHPTLRSLCFREDRAPTSSTKRARTKSVADMLLANKRVDRIHFDSDTFDRDDWNACVAPVLDCNLYRDWIVAIQKIQDPSTRAAVVARALARVESKPSLVWMILSHNHDVVCSYVDEALDDSVSVPSPKRRRAPSDDDQGDRD
jgi:hypothetical protein